MRHYFLGLAIFGLACEALLFVGLLGDALRDMFSLGPNAKFGIGMFITVLAGIFATLKAGSVLDRKQKFENIWGRILGGPVVFFCGTLVGCLMNYLIQGVIIEIFFKKFPGTYYPMREIDSWFVRPFLALNLYGIPASAIVALIYQGVRSILRTRSAPQKADS